MYFVRLALWHHVAQTNIKEMIAFGLRNDYSTLSTRTDILTHAVRQRWKVIHTYQTERANL